MSLLQTPDNWNSELLENLLVHIIGGDWGKDPDHQEKDYQAVACIRGSEFRNWSKESGRTAVLRKVKANSLDKRSLLPGDILLEISGGGPDQPVGRTVLINQAVLDQFDIPVVGTNFLRLLRPSAALDQRFLNKYLELFYSSGEVIKYQGGSNNLRNLKFKEYSQISVPVPPLAEQKVIADKLDTLLAQVENTKARLERIPQILKRFRQSVLASAVNGRLTEEWRALHDFEEDSWSSMPLKNIAEVLDPNPSHRYPKPEFGGIPILSTQQFAGYSGWTTDKAKQVSRDFFDERKGKCGFYEDDIIFARKGRLGLARFAPKGFDYVYSHTVFIVRPRRNVSPSFLLWSLRPDSVVDYLLMAMNSNTGVPTLGKGVFEKMEVNVPSPEEQTEIVRRVDQLFAHADRIEQQVNNALVRVNNLTQSILAKAFRGELTEQWRKDNPELISGENSAEALLERIKAERAAMKPVKKTRSKQATV
ncbi:restriction endonuclease S subunit [Marinobacter santoriniensis NKSG1]|uniref:Restriction endonuclease S subunit n=1 Tax=Marinobacter santoriniensis NKSG1 TaxID=1288826 RepID=M7D1F1_9GAMM|nr:restriction endonuclease subunit S [Marinobacter santoriniensis]EMP54578.1 restriction endonuclease S subunit [Marinobacter santoriniensis NKSG1]